MANQVAGNPLVIDTGSTTVTGRQKIKQIQWVDDNADIADNDDLVLVINGQTLTYKVQRGATPDIGVCVYGIGPFSPPLIVDTFEVTTIDHGSLLVWLG